MSASAQKVQYSSKHREAERALPLAVTGGTATLRARVAAGTGVSLVVADVDSDGTPDILSGYATATGGALLLQRGSSVALAPTPREWAMQAAGELVAPYAAKAEPMELPVRPDLLKSADISGHGFADLIFAQKGDTSLYLAFGDGSGNFAAATAIPLAGRITSLATWRNPSGDSLLVAGVCGSQGCGLQFLDRGGVTQAFVATPAPVTSIESGRIDLGRQLDLAMIAGVKVLVLDGDTALSSSPVIETLPVAHAAALALGSFVPDHHSGLQIAVLDEGATLRVLTRRGIDASYDPEIRRAQQRSMAARLASGPLTKQRPQPEAKRTGLPWTEAETVANVGSGGAALMFRARLSGGGNDDLAVMAGSQYVTVAHPVVREGAVFKTTPVLTVDSTSGAVAAALPARISADARQGIVTLAATGGAHPLTVTVPASNKTMTVNTIADGTPTATSEALCTNHQAGCTLRSALTVANLDRSANGESKVDTVNVSGGTYVLSAVNTNSSGQTMNPDYLGSANIRLEIEASVNLVGAGSAITIINANNADQAIEVDFGGFYATTYGDFESAPLDAFISGVTIENGKNATSTTTGPCSTNGQAAGDCNYNGGNLSWTIEGASNLVISNVVMTNGNSPISGGGGIYAFYDTGSSGTAGPLEIDNSSLTNNVASHADSEGGGGICMAQSNSITQPLILSSDIITGNTAPSNGGGILLEYGQGPVTITNSTISNNTAYDSVSPPNSEGGGLWVEQQLTMTGSTVSNNSAGPFGGGMYVSGATFAQTITSSNFLSNKLLYTYNGYTYNQDGAGVCLEGEDNAETYTLHYNRFHGNTGNNNPHATGLAVGCHDDLSGSETATVNASDNWWGCIPTTAANTTTAAYAIAGTGCDTAALGNVKAGSASLTVTPYTTLLLNLSTTTPSYNTNLVATASLGQDSSGNVYSAAADAAYLATPITTFTLSNTSNASYNPSSTAFTNTASSTSFAAATDTAVVNSTGNGTATLTVDGATLTKSFSVVASDLTVTSAHTGNFKAGDATDTYTLTVANVGNASTSGTVLLTDMLPSGFTATGLSGSGWTCTLSSVSCTRSDSLSASVTYPSVTLTVSVSSADAGTYTNTATVSGGSEANSNNDTSTDPTIVVGVPTIAEAFSPTTVAPNATSTVTFTLGNPSMNAVSLTGVNFTDQLPTGLRITTAATTSCTSGTAGGAVNGTSITLSGATIGAGATCTVTAGVASSSIGSYPNPTSAVMATNSNAGGTATATLTVSVTPTRVIFTSVPPSTATAGGNAGTVQAALEDGSGNIATNNSTAQVTLTVTGPSAYSQTYGPTTVTNGVASYNLSSVPLTAAGAYTYTLTSSGLTSGTASETVNPGAATALLVSGLTTFTAPGQSQTVTVKAIDSYGNAATSFTGTVTLSSTDALATFSPASYTYTAANAGIQTFTVTLGTAGTQSLTASSSSLSGVQPAISVLDAILVVNPGGTFSRLTDAGVATSPSAGYAGGGTPTVGAAIDGSGNIFSLNTTGNVLVEFSKAATALSGSGFMGGGLSAPVALAIDGLGQVWIANGNGTVSEFSNAGAAISPAAGYAVGGTASTGVAIDISGNVWVTNSNNSTVTEVLGGAAPVNPLAIAVTAVKLGARP